MTIHNYCSEECALTDCKGNHCDLCDMAMVIPDKIEKSDLVDRPSEFRFGTDTYLSIADFDNTCYTLKAEFPYAAYVMIVEFKCFGEYGGTMNIRIGHKSVECPIDTALFYKYFVKYATRHIEDFSTYLYMGEKMLIDFYNEVLSNNPYFTMVNE